MQPNGMHLPGEAGSGDPNALGYADGGATAAAGATGPHGAAGDAFGGPSLADHLITGSAFAMNRERAGGVLSFWSRGAQLRFRGCDGALGLSGDVRTTMAGAAYARGPLVVGLSLEHSRGLGEYARASAIDTHLREQPATSAIDKAVSIQASLGW